VRPGDSIFYSKGYIILEKITTKDSIPFAAFQPGDKATVASLKIHSFNKTSYNAAPLLINQKGNLYALADTITSEGLIVRINAMATDGKDLDIGVKESGAVLEYVTLKAYKFPFINVLWLGIIITAIGIIISMVRRIQLNRLKNES
jgi:cytochrome c-type biogenesis protein CcmF